MNVSTDPTAVPALSACEPLRIALVQLAPRLGDIDYNLGLHQEMLAEARRAQADIAVFPELSLTGYALRDMTHEAAREIDSPTIRALAEAAEGLEAVCGFVEHSPEHRFYNAGGVFSEGAMRHVHRKVYLPTYGLFDEQRYFAQGDRFRVYNSPRCGRVGVLVCEDLWHLSSALVLAAQDVDLIVCICNSPARGMKDAEPQTAGVYDRLCRTYAELLGVAIVLVNRGGVEDGLCFWGGSFVVGPDGEVIARAPLFDECVHLAVVDKADLRRRRIAAPLGRDERWSLTIEELRHARRHATDE